MPHLTEISLEGFRIFKHPAHFALAPLTILTGPNSSGKSSLLKGLLLLQKNARPGRLEQLDFTGGLHSISGFAAAAHHDVPSNITFTIGVADALGVSLPGSAAQENNRRESHPARELGKKEEKKWKWPDQVYFTLEFGAKGLSRCIIKTGTESRRQLLCLLEIKGYEFAAKSNFGSRIGEETSWVDFFYELRINGEWFYEHLGGTGQAIIEALDFTAEEEGYAFLHWLRRPLVFHGSDLDIKLELDHLLWLAARGTPGTPTEDGVSQENNVLHELADDLIRHFRQQVLHPLLRRLLNSLLDTLATLTYVGHQHDFTRRIYQADGQEKGFYELLHRYQIRGKSHPEKSESRFRLIEEWMQTFGIGERIDIEPLTDLDYLIRIRRGDQQIFLSDLGRGHAHLLPLILHMGLQTDERTLLIEEPEANLHPNLQSRLADLFLSIIGEDTEQAGTYLRNRLLVETHSEYLIRRLQYLVATGEAKPERIAIYYLGPDPEADDYIRRITITPSGQLSQEFGPGFLDEATNLMVDLFKYGNQN